jgi:hypothetical protein
VTSTGVGGQSRQFPANSLMNGCSKKPFLSNRGGELLSTLLQCQSLPTSFPTSCENGYSAYKVNPPLYKLRRGGNTVSVGVTSFNRQHLRGGSDQARTKPATTAHVVTLSSLLFSRCTQSTYLTSLMWTEAKIQDSCNKRSLSLVMFILTSFNEHIILRQARDARCLTRMSVQ